MKLIEVEQGTPEWFKARAGRFTASKIHLLEKEPKSKKDKEAGKLADGAVTYVMQKVWERVSGQLEEEVFSKSLEWGNEWEPVAIERYELLTGRKVRKAGFAAYGLNAGASTDGLVSFDGIIEVKCPYKDFMKRVLEDPFDNREYYLQMQMGLLATGREWCDYIIFDPRMPEGKDLVIQRIGKDLAAFATIKKGIAKAEKWAKIWTTEAERKFAETLKKAA